MPVAKPKDKARTATKQLRIAFDRQDTIRQNLREGVFSILVELTPPTREQPIKLAMAPRLELAKFIKKDKRVVSLAIRPPDDGAPMHDILEVAPEVLRVCKKETLVYLNGTGLTPHAARECIAGLASLGINSFAGLTGSAAPDHPRDKHGRPLANPDGYLDSVRLLRLIREAEPTAFVGAAVNPFKYHLADCHLQYYKMLKKLHSGADFIVTQAGWDMKKYQELQWYLRSRELDEPFIARLLLLRPDDVTRILDHKSGGLVVSREFAALLQRESQINEAQALAAQLRRLSLQAAGCRLFGYSGIQLAGVDDPRLLGSLLDQVEEALTTYETYDAWLKAWTDFHSHVEMAPYPHRYYVFKRLLDPEAHDYLGDQTPHTSETVPPPPLGARLAWSVASKLDLGHRRGVVADLARKALCGSRGSHPWRLDKTLLISASGCPKGLEDGPCEASHPDGTCEFGHQPCFYHRVLQLAQWRNNLEHLEAPAEPATPTREPSSPAPAPRPARPTTPANAATAPVAVAVDLPIGPPSAAPAPAALPAAPALPADTTNDTDTETRDP